LFRPEGFRQKLPPGPGRFAGGVNGFIGPARKISPLSFFLKWGTLGPLLNFRAVALAFVFIGSLSWPRHAARYG
jgi:hypothetical protein